MEARGSSVPSHQVKTVYAQEIWHEYADKSRDLGRNRRDRRKGRTGH